MAKCLKYGWYLPYSPPEYETGSWKRHYIACVQTLDYVTSSVSTFVFSLNILILISFARYLFLDFKED